MGKPFVSIDRHRSPRQKLIPVLSIAAGLCVIVAATILLVDYWPAITGFIQQMQNSLHRELAEAIQQAKQNKGMAFWALIGVSFLYGIFHAAGPGHGKMVIATYMLSHPADVRRGLVISTLSSLAQGVTAVVAVGAGAWALNWSARDSNTMAGHLEVASYILIAGIGAFLAFSSVRRMVWRRHAGPHGDHAHCHHHGHAPHPEDTRDVGLLQAGAMIFSIGIRPCSGAILVLILAFALEIFWGGVIAVFAMSIGTALTVSTLAILAVGARSLASRLSHGMSDNRILIWAGDAVALAGGVLILTLGISLARGALAIQSHPLL